jgi:hypothetical protein
MDLIMAGADNVLTYIDDLLVHSKNHSDHLVHLANALDRVGKANLRLNLTKCIFGRSLADRGIGGQVSRPHHHVRRHQAGHGQV